jgi:ubiquinone/menaquinone biosynthesis C-methylase UbiE
MQVTGVDGSKGMLAVARRKLRGRPVTLLRQDVRQRLDLPDKGFDIAIASYVLHGFPQALRLSLYREMARLARERVIVHDFTGRRAWYIDLVEQLEGSAYRDFVAHAEEEMTASFGRLEVIPVDTRAAWYWARP